MDVYIGGYGIGGIMAATLRNRAISIARKLTKAYANKEFDAVVVTGSSGVGMGFAIRAVLQADVDIPFVIVRKDGEGSHAGRLTCPDFASSLDGLVLRVNKFVILDDLVATGATVQRLCLEMGDAKLVRVYTYDQDYEWAGERYTTLPNGTEVLVVPV
jgi:adenine/guanine phosphoribosyltransferase-like PRPP-binding protein